ncbi:hypothetical protein PJ267_17890 [Arthrobacter sp. OVS8]|nr:hypothetical protein PJ267_17890 [Arthrobacter sp. OVS8]
MATDSSDPAAGSATPAFKSSGRKNAGSKASGSDTGTGSAGPRAAGSPCWP